MTKQQLLKNKIFEKNRKVTNIPESKKIEILPFKAFIALHDENVKGKGYFSFIIQFPKIQATGKTKRKTLKNLKKETYKHFETDETYTEKPSVTHAALTLMNCVSSLRRCSIIPFDVKVNIIDDNLPN